jgi:UDP-N-acetylmuramoyl-tripeptide--D-alanyl-D-alanine ligase
VLNADNAWFDLFKVEARRAKARIVSFGADVGCEAQLTGFALTCQGAKVSARLHGRAIDFPIRQSGMHWGMNSLAVLLMLDALNVPLETGLSALADFAPLAGRGAERSVNIAGGAFVLIDDSYNANPVSMAAALASLAARPVAGRRIVALTDMLELGEDAGQRHADLALEVERAGVDLVFCAGPLMHALWEALPPTRRGGYAQTAAELAPEVADAMRPGDVVLVKGSNGSQASRIVEALTHVGQTGEAG